MSMNGEKKTSLCINLKNTDEIHSVNLKLKIGLKYRKHIVKPKLEKKRTKVKFNDESGENYTFTCDLMVVRLLPCCQDNSVCYKM